MEKRINQIVNSGYILILGLLVIYSPRLQAHIENLPEVPRHEKIINFATIYATQWTFYLLTQEETIEKHGSFENWIKYPLRPHYDKDNFDYNLTKHTFVGHYYYLFYRSRGYTEQSAFMWTVASSLAFEFTIETVTERPSYQDIYQTPVFGTVLGVGVERLSQYLNKQESWYSKTASYVLNPFLLLPPTSGLFSTFYVKPDNGELVGMFTWSF